MKGAIIVSTPQDLALIDARRGLAMFTRVNVPVLGIIENMSYFQCPHCGTRSDIFGHGGARHEAEKLGVPFLGEVPLAHGDPRHLGFRHAAGGKRTEKRARRNLSCDRRTSCGQAQAARRGRLATPRRIVSVARAAVPC